MAPRASAGRPTDWFWEGNVQRVLVEHLAREGWSIAAVADPWRHEPGPDIDARKLHRYLVVEVKGYPPVGFIDPRRAGEVKKTRPRLQAHHWFGAALLKAVQLADGAGGLEVAIALPDFEDYRTLIDSCERTLRTLGIGIYLVRSDGGVDLALEHRSRAEAVRSASVVAEVERHQMIDQGLAVEDLGSE